ncbi:MAG: hypothetical protein NXI31_17310 [bacterium]|nr:hypothetical protein [bacterium]
MNTFRALLFLLAFATAGGCWGGGGSTGNAGPGGQVAAAVTGGGRVLLDPFATTAVALGIIVLANTLPVGTADGDIRFRLPANSDVDPEVDEVTLAPGETRQVFVRALVPVLAVLTLVVIAEYVVSGLVRDFTVSWQNAAADSNALGILGALYPTQLTALFFLSAILSPIGILTRHSSALVPPKLPLLNTDVRMFGAMFFFFTLARLQQLFDGTLDNVTFPVGQGAEGYTVKATPSVPLAEGDYCLFWHSVAEDIPLADATQQYQFAFVMDSDANASNNYVASPNFPNDFFAGTDRWYELNYTPANGWTLRCRVVGPGNSVNTVASAAHVIVRGDTMLLLVPRSEFAVARPPFRVTTFCHTGDYGIPAPHDWSGDPTPTVAEPLHAW